MPYTNNKESWLRDRINMTFGSLLNRYSGVDNAPSPEELLEKAVHITGEIWERTEPARKDNELGELEVLLAKQNEERVKERVLGRYHASELYQIMSGRLKPADFFKPEEFDGLSLRRMYWGVAIHEAIQKLYDYEETKIEHAVTPEITLVGKCDLDKGTKKKPLLVEIKSKEDPFALRDVPAWYDLQCQAYLEMVDAPEMELWVVGWAFEGKKFIVKRNKDTWKEIVKALTSFHEQVKEVK